VAPRERDAAVLAFALLGFKPKVRGVKVCFDNLDSAATSGTLTHVGDLIESMESFFPGTPYHLRITQGRGLHLEIL